MGHKNLLLLRKIFQKEQDVAGFSNKRFALVDQLHSYCGNYVSVEFCGSWRKKSSFFTPIPAEVKSHCVAELKFI